MDLPASVVDTFGAVISSLHPLSQASDVAKTTNKNHFVFMIISLRSLREQRLLQMFEQRCSASLDHLSQLPARLADKKYVRPCRDFTLDFLGTAMREAWLIRHLWHYPILSPSKPLTGAHGLDPAIDDASPAKEVTLPPSLIHFRIPSLLS
jgi:hypothetical protein